MKAGRPRAAGGLLTSGTEVAPPAPDHGPGSARLTGFGMRAWAPGSHEPGRPFVYASQSLPVFDRNLKNLAEKVRAGCVLAHVRGVAYSTRVDISLQNVHPFQFDGVPWSLAHNGDLAAAAKLGRVYEMTPLAAE